MKEIPLSRGMVALVDDHNYGRLSEWNWCVQRNGKLNYAVRDQGTAKGKSIRIQMHREVIEATHGQLVDHINGNGLDNQRSNLRLCTRAQNRANAGGRGTKKSSRFKGVSARPGCRGTIRWQANIRINGKAYALGMYATEEEAACVYYLASKAAWGEFAFDSLTPQSVKVPLDISSLEH